MPTAKPISKEFKKFDGVTAAGNPKKYSVCIHCGFEDGIMDEAHVKDCGKMGSTRTQRKFFHLQKCKAVSEEIRNKYDNNGELKKKQSVQSIELCI